MKTPSVPPEADLEQDPDAPPSEEELREAAALRDALADSTRPHEAAAFARALVLAHAPRPLDARENEVLVERALGAEGAGAARVSSLADARARWGRRALIAGAVSTLSVAAAIAFFQVQRGAPEPVASLQIPARSSQPLFHEPFAASGGTSARIDRIAAARAADLRENMFARWDVR